MSLYRIRTSLLLAAATACSLTLGACGTTGQADPSPPAGDAAGAMASMPGMAGMPGTAAPGAPAAPTAPVATDAVTIQNFAYAPATITVRAGTTVTWTNSDTDAHTVTSSDNGPLHSAALNTGATYRYTFTKPGSYPYLCTIHPFMTATVVVTP
jgi:plastocyanin